MVTVEQIQKGVASYLDAELMPNLHQEGLQKVLAGTAIGLAIKRSGSMIHGFTESPFIKMLGIVDEEGNIDIDVLKDELKENITEKGFNVDIPMLGTMTFHKEDVDKLHKHIKGGTV